ncbi:DNA methyltransferase [Flavobacterium sp. NG2]|uniref:TaqI-like C-terminal specificity domain-containing protein n=1 Tax=Flavobacterium sp. NG2 TaxID=3097547 RepID=UPI002A8147A1|nr:TaqI-like C-terminal specificity domain-containing protein [Flavobacterium sp. NG2]WPR71832.1 DNA methyltransferase [Flavobacterium sp. NG2]
MNYIDFFSRLGFNFNSDLKHRTIEFERNNLLSKNLKNSVYFYKSPNNTNTSFYLITTELNPTEIEDVRKYIWNKNDADLIFYYPREEAKLDMFYAKYSPKVSNEESKLDAFSTSEKNLDKIEQIKLWKFNSGVFWLNYLKAITKAKYKGIDKELVFTLKALKEQLYVLLSKLITEETECNKTVQALIDRTLYIKYLEDKHIINSRFYDYYFKDASLNYQKILENHSNADVNKLFGIIHAIFNNNLFDQPTIDNQYLTNGVRSLIATSFKANTNTGQLRLFDFQFDVLPVEFISYIYEVFLSDKQKENGIYYTPKKLAQLIVDEVINEDRIGSILDPSSGSGMFLIVGYQRLLEIAKKQGLEPEDSIGKIKFRSKLLADNVFGIEKELTAQRFTIFSLSLQIFEGINPKDIKDYIANELSQKGKVELFAEFSFFENIKQVNSLNTLEKPFEDKQFSYLLGNPPFFEIPNTEEYRDEISFLNSYEVTKENRKLTAKNIVGKFQISQCFFLKIKDWSNENTRSGFVSNSSNFYNDKSESFQEYFYSNYGIEKIYELSRVKKILFEKANESVIALIFTNHFNNNTIEYYPVDLGLFSEKPFELLIIQEDKVVEIEQNKLISKIIRLRDFLIGNEFDRYIIDSLSSIDIVESYLTKNKAFSSYKGLDRLTNKDLLKFYNIKDYLGKDQLADLHQKYANEKYLNNNLTSYYNTPFIHKPENKLFPFLINSVDGYVNKLDISQENFQRVRNKFIYEGEKILINKFGKKVQAVYVRDNLFFSNLIYVLKLNNPKLYFFFTAIINSDLINYFIIQKFKSRTGDNFSNVSTETIKNIPIPKNLDEYLVVQISNISKDLTEGKFEYSEKKEELNELIYELYELSYWEKQRIRDYFLPNERIGRKKNKLENYKTTVNEILSFYLKNPITIEETPADFNLIVVKISLNNNYYNPKANKTKKFILNEIFEHDPNGNFLASQEKIYSDDCVYIIKEDINKNWTETKAFEDGQDIIKQLIPSGNGERIH